MEIKMLVMDVDGTLTDGKIYMSASGELMKAFNIKDGYAIARLRDYGIEPVVITGRESEIVKKRCKELKITELYQGISNKLFCLNSICKKRGIKLSQVAYIGDDVNDLQCLMQCGSSACPADAVEEVKKSAAYVCHVNGGDGAVREFVEFIIRSNAIEDEVDDEIFNLNELVFEEDPYINI